MAEPMRVQHFYDPVTGTLTYVLSYPGQKDAIVIDPVWDFDMASGQLSQESIKPVVQYLKLNNLKPILILETHVHADHVSGSSLIRKDWHDTPIMIGSRIAEVQKVFKELFNYGPDFLADGSQFDILMKDQDTWEKGPFKIKAHSAPGHTPVDTIYEIDTNLFVGDLIFMPDSGTGRCDFPGGNAESLYHSVTDRLYSFPDHYVLYTGHDYKPGGRELKFSCTVLDSKRENSHIKMKTNKSEFVNFRTERDRTLSVPKLILPSLQINMNAGALPKKDLNGVSYLRIPIKLKE